MVAEPSGADGQHKTTEPGQAGGGPRERSVRQLRSLLCRLNGQLIGSKGLWTIRTFNGKGEDWVT